MRGIPWLRRWAPRGLAALFAASGTLHLLQPERFEPIVPRFLPAPTALVYLTGAAEIVCAVGLVASRRWAAYASVALLVAILPANVQYAIDQSASPLPNGAAWAVAAWIRVPLQIPLIWAALQVRRDVSSLGDLNRRRRPLRRDAHSAADDRRRN